MYSYIYHTNQLQQVAEFAEQWCPGGELQQGPAADNSRRLTTLCLPNNPHTDTQLSRESRSLTPAAILEKPSVGERADEVG